MKNNKDVEKARTPPPLPFSLRLRSIKSSRQSMARILRAWASGEINEADAKTAAYLMSQLLAFFKASTEVELEEALKKMEKRLKTLEGNKNVSEKIKRIS